MNDSRPQCQEMREMLKNCFHRLRNEISLLIESKSPFVPFHHLFRHLKT
jgi:hypothetical protein